MYTYSNKQKAQKQLKYFLTIVIVKLNCFVIVNNLYTRMFKIPS